MFDRLQPLYDACLPFVTRALRGPRKRRFVLAAGLVTLAVMLLGTWVGLSPSRSAHDLRVGLDMEEYRHTREEAEFVIIVDSPSERDALVTQAADSDLRYGVVRYRTEAAWTLLDTVASPHVIPPRQHQALQARARRLRDARLDLAPDDLDDQRRYTHFDWNSRRDLQRLGAIIDAELQPQVLVYTSPLGMADTLRIWGIMASGLWLLLLTVVAPLWVGVRLAQELHDNTLQPLTGTALTARQLVAGLVAGPLSPVALVAAPILVLVLGTAVGVGRVLPAVGMLVASGAMGALLVGLAMLLALAVGRQRAPGIVGIGLLALLGVAALGGVGVGLNLRGNTLGLVSIVPGAGSVHLLTEAFAPVAHLHASAARALDLRLGLATVGALVLAGFALRAIERWVGGTHRQGALGRAEAVIAALILSGLAVSVLPSRAGFGETFLVGMALVIVPLQLVLMGRVPGGDVPPSLRQLPILRLLGEHTLWLGLTLLVSVVVAGGPDHVRAGLPVGLLHLGWALVVVPLVTIRASALPTSIPTKLWLIVCLAFVTIEFGTGAVWCMDNPDAEMLFPLAAASPVLGLLHVGMFLWIPVSLVRALGRPGLPVLNASAPRDPDPSDPA